MAIDIARGMNYLHRCQPPIIHRNLKSSNLLVDKNFTLKVADFGLSRMKHETYLATTIGTGTPHWMAPEVLRNEQVDEKSDVYSYGVVLWEITTRKVPWENLNSTQVIRAVGFMNQQLEIPNDVDPQWASLIETCLSREAQSRPTFQEILVKLKDLQKKFTIQFQVPEETTSAKRVHKNNS
ncbi:putative serine/threonine-protein kinase SIS8 [Bidens hawaiensis]|uniref:putative serine/threonine-protein kinase SIS8 n=1 Tax=Bidens hawaiensis TaxID=980011 RepID=UPI004049A14B